MMKPIKFICITILIVAIFMPEARAAPKTRLFINPALGISFEIPPGKWEIKEGFGNLIAKLEMTAAQRTIRIGWFSGPQVLPPDDLLLKLVLQKFGSAKISSVEEISEGEEKFPCASFDIESSGPVKKRGMIILTPVNDGIVEISCDSNAKEFVPLFFECQKIAASVRSIQIKKPASPGEIEITHTIAKLRNALASEPASYEAAARLVLARALFAYQDGRGGCPGIADEPKKFSVLAAEFGDMRTAGRLEEMARLLKESQDFESEDILAARENLNLIEGGSRLLSALKIKAARQNGDLPAAESIFAQMESPVCGRSGAIAAHNFGLLMKENNPDKAARLFNEAIEAAPSYVPAYLSMGQMYLDRGDGANVAIGNMGTLLSRAPETLEMKNLKRQIDALRQRQVENSGGK